MAFPTTALGKDELRPRESGRLVIFGRSRAEGKQSPSRPARLDSNTRKRLLPPDRPIRGATVPNSGSNEENGEPIEAKVTRLLAGRPLVLVGMMGAGKSSIGRRLATRLGLPFVDADTEIEIAANASIPEIFDRHGEAYFRDGERRVIQRLLDGKPKVLAAGGGAFLQPETRAAIQKHAISIWLKADRDLLLSRTRRRASRPLLRDGDPAETIERLIAERYPVYAEADIHVQSRDIAHDAVIDDLLAALADYLGREAVAEA
jgi:shikimate kinase